MKTRIVIHQVNGKISRVLVSGETEVYLIQQDSGLDFVGEIDTEEFRVGKAHEAFTGLPRRVLRDKKV